MIKCLRKLLFSSLAVIFTTTTYADGVSFDSSDNMLLIPAISVNDRFVANGRLKLETNGQFVIEGFIELSDNENTILEKIESLPCGPADLLGRLAARNAFVSGDESYCLVKESIITTEGGSIFEYILIENGNAQFITDNRLDSFSTCCFESESEFTQVKFGFIENDVFTEQTAVDQIDFDREYILQMTGEGDNEVKF